MTPYEEQSEATRSALLAAARELLGKYGYQDTRIGMVASAAHVTTGAIYHHFHGKKALFQATVESLQKELLADAANAGGSNRWERLRASFDVMIERHSDPTIHRIVFVEAPQVIGPERWEQIALRYAYGKLRTMLSGLIAKKVVRDYPPSLLARLLIGLMREASAEIAESGGDARIRAQVADFVERFFGAIHTGHTL